MAAPLLLHVFPTFAFGGAQVRFTSIANYFGRRWRHAVVSMDGNLACRERLSPALDVQFPAIPVCKGDTLGNVRRFRAALAGMRPHALLTSNFGSIEWAIANRIRLVRHIHLEDGFGPEERARQLLRRVWLRRVFLRGRTVVLPSRTLVRIATETWRLDRVRYIPNGVDLARFGGPPARAPWPGEGPVVGTVAALRGEKNLPRLLRAFRLATEHAPARLVVAGDGPDRAALQGLAAELGIGHAVHWAGHVEQPAPLYKAFDVFAMSSDTEQMPLSLLEAMAAGLPVAATDVGDIAAMLPPEGRPFVTALDDAALGEALRTLIGSPELRRELGAANRTRAEQEFDQDAMLAAWGRVIEDG